MPFHSRPPSGLAVILLATFQLLLLMAPPAESGFSASPASAPFSRTENLTASRDAYVVDTNPNGNFGAISELLVGRDSATGIDRSLIGFNLSAIPFYADVIAATLRARTLETNSSRAVDLYRVRAPWTEGTGFLYEREVTVRETAGLPRTREPVLVQIPIPGGIQTNPRADFRVYDSLGQEVPSQVVNVSMSGGKVTGVELAFASSHAALETKTYRIRYGVDPSVPVPPYRTKGLSATPLWTYDAASRFSSSAIADLNGDGLLEVIVGSLDGRVVDLQWNGSALSTLWTYHAPAPVDFPIEVTDLTGNGDQEVLFATDGVANRSITALDARGRYLWSFSLPSFDITGRVLGPFAAADTNADGIVEVYVGIAASYPVVYGLRGSDGTPFCTYIDSGATGAVLGVALGDVQGTASPDIVAVDTLGHVRIRERDCRQGTSGQSKPGPSVPLDPASLANLTDNAQREIVVGDHANASSQEFVVRGSDFTVLNATSPAGANITGQIVADADGDGIVEVYFVTADGALHRASRGMNLAWAFTPGANGGGYGIPSAADINADGKPEILYGTDGTVSSDAALYAIAANGSQVMRYPIGPGVMLRTTPVVADLDGDGTLEVIVASDNSTDPSKPARVYAFGTGSLGHDSRTGSYNTANTGLWLDGNSPDGKALLNWTLGTLRATTGVGVTWNTRDGLTAWATPGIDMDSSPLASTTVTAGSWASWNVTAMVQGWVNGTSPNNGFALRAQDETLDWNASFAAREYGAGFEPVLEVTYVADPSPQIVGLIPDQTRPEDAPAWTLDLRLYVYDPDTPATRLYWDVIGLNASLLQVSGTNLLGNHVLTFRPQPNAFGTDDAVFVLYDDAGNSDRQDVRIEITPVDDAPKFDPPAVFYVRFDTPYTFDFDPYMSDIDDLRASLTLGSDDPLHATVSGHNVTFLYPQSYSNTWVYVILTVTDPLGAGAARVVAVKVTAQYPPKLTTPLPDVTLTEGEFRRNVFDLDNYFTDPDQDSLFFSYGFTHLIVTINSDHTVDMQAEAGFTGQETVTFRATDPTGAIAEDTILVTVIPINDPPVFTSLPPLVVRYDVPYRFDLTPYVSDSDTPVGELVVTTSNPSNVTVDGLVLTLVYPPRLGSLAWPYAIPLTVAVSDGVSVAAETTTVTVTDDYPPVLLRHLPNVTFPEDTVKLQAFDLDDYFLDTDGLVQLTARTANVTVNIRTNHSVDFGALTNWSGQQAVVFRATDDRGAIAEDTMYVTVLPVNDAPVILPIPKQVHDGLGSWVLDLTPFLRDSDNGTGDLVLSTGGHPRVRAVGRFLVFDYSQAAFHETVTVTVSDGLATSTATVEVEVIPANPLLAALPWLVALSTGLGLLLLVRFLRPTVEEVFLIHWDGRKIAHLTRSLTPERDTDVVAAMFTALQSVIHESFRELGAGRFRSMKLGTHRVTVVSGQSFYLAVIFRGRWESVVRRKAEEVVKQVERRFGKTLATWSGYVSEIEGIRSYVESFFGAKAAMEVRKRDDKSGEPPRQVEGDVPPPLMPQ